MQGVPDIGLGAMLGSNIFAIPLVITISYLGIRAGKIAKKRDATNPDRILHIEPEAEGVQALPYLAIICLLAAATLPAPWRGLQPIDGWIMLAAYFAYLCQAILRRRHAREPTRWTRHELRLAIAGLIALAGGAYLIVRAVESLVTALGIPPVIGGLFIAAPAAAIPELFAAWSLARSGQLTTGLTSVVGDNAVTLTVSVLPLALIAAPIGDFRLYCVSLAFIALMPLLYALFLHFDHKRPGFRGWHVLVFIAALSVMGRPYSRER